MSGIGNTAKRRAEAAKLDEVIWRNMEGLGYASMAKGWEIRSDAKRRKLSPSTREARYLTFTPGRTRNR